MTGRPVNLGLTDALSRIGGFSSPQLPELLPGIQPVLVYGNVASSVASEVFEARGLTGDLVNGFTGLEIAAAAPGGIVIEEIDAVLIITGLGPPTLGVNIASAPAGGVAVPKLDCGGVATGSLVRRLAGPVAFGAQLVYTTDAVIPAGPSSLSVQNRTRIWVPSGLFFQAFPVTGAVISESAIHITWRELSDVQGNP